MTEGKSPRAERVAARIRAELAEMLLRGAIHEPDASGALISSVRVTPDLSIAHVGLRALEAAPTEDRKKRLVQAMRRAAGFVRKEVGGRLGIRTAPELRFSWDVGVDNATRIETLLGEVRSPRSGNDDGGTP